jgi:hypothetical protein
MADRYNWIVVAGVCAGPIGDISCDQGFQDMDGTLSI